ncbi:MAG: glycosyltransferase family 4 protein [Chloroflexi bacterium]|nr:glycosyltransferase family 4 protein [Chloroflexota bacterium]
MKIAMIGARGIAAKYSGIETHLEELCPRLVERGHKVVVYARRYFTTCQDYRGVKIVALPTIRTKHIETLLHTLVATVHSLQSDADIVHYHAQGPAVFSLLPRLNRKVSVVTCHGLDWQRGKWGTFARWCLKGGELASVVFPNAVIVVSRSLHDYYTGRYGATKVHYIPNGVRNAVPRLPTLLKSVGLEPNRYVLFVGRLTPEKGCHYLVEAYQNLDADMKLVIVGAPAYTDSYAQSLRESGNGKVLFLGTVFGDLLEELYSNAYLFVLPSLMEGLSISLLEAMSYGCCVLASDIPQNAEVVGECGLLFKAGDASSLSHTIRRALAEPHAVRQLGNAAKQRVSLYYDWDSVVAKTEELYSYVLGNERDASLGMAEARE